MNTFFFRSFFVVQMKAITLEEIEEREKTAMLVALAVVIVMWYAVQYSSSGNKEYIEVTTAY